MLSRYTLQPVTVSLRAFVCADLSTMFPWRSGPENVSEDNNKLKLSYKTVGTAYSPINVPPEDFELCFLF